MSPSAIAQTLVIVGASIFLLLGALHGVLTLIDVMGTPRYFTPRNAALRQAMQQSTLAIHPATNLWRAWLGFNLSHSLGVMLFGGAFVVIGGLHMPLYAGSAGLQACAVLVSAAYLAMSVRYWFYKPTAGAAIALACFVAAAALSRL